jgi:hypothetical protein
MFTLMNWGAMFVADIARKSGGVPDALEIRIESPSNKKGF